MKILILANHYNTLRIFRRELIKAISQKGHEIIISIPPCDDENKKILESYGASVTFTELDRRGTNPLKDIKLLRKYMKLIKSLKPDKVITYTIKCNVYGGLACKRGKIDHYANVTGLGSAFQGQSFIRKIVSLLYKVSLNCSKRVFFENSGNRDTLVNDKIVKDLQAFVLNGAGVNLDEFRPMPYPKNDEVIRFLFVGRIMREKGVDEYFECIRRIKTEHINTEFAFIGWYEDDYEQTVISMQNDDLLEFHGFQPDVKPFIERAHCVVLPSWHEGMSNTLLESAAMCRPLITTNVHGCKEAVKDAESGYLCEVRNSDSLYAAIKRFIELSPDEREAMGLRGRELMQASFDKNDVVNITINEIFADV